MNRERYPCSHLPVLPVFVQVAVARALGGDEWQAGGIINTADVTGVQLDQRHGFVILATDGIWGPVECESVSKRGGGATASSERIVWAASSAFDAGADGGTVADGLTRMAKREGGTDNSCCIVLKLRGHSP